MKFAVMATGGVGGYFGARLAAAGEDVHFIARGAHLEVLRKEGLTLHSANGDLRLARVSATDDPSSIGAADIVIFAVKQYDTAVAARAIVPLMGAETAVITLQNGVDKDDRLAAILGPNRVMGGVAYIAAAAVAAPGVITHVGTLARIIFGELDGAATARAKRFLAACQKAAIDATLSTHIATDLWAKFALLSAFSGVGSLTRKPIGMIRSDPDLRKVLSDAIAEAIAVARAKGAELGRDYLARQMGLVDGFAPETQSSMQMDLAQGRRLELEWMSGAVARLGDALGVLTPVHHVIYAALKSEADGRR